MTKYDYAVFIGRFQPYHAGHHHVATEALKLANNLIFVLGSSGRPRCSRNPFTTAERIDIIKSCFPKIQKTTLYDNGIGVQEYKKFSLDFDDPRIHFAPQVDYTYNEERWIAAIQASVNSIIFNKLKPDPIKIAIVGYSKDHSSYYLKRFPHWDLIEIEPVKLINATGLRYIIFNTLMDWHEYVVTKAHADKITHYAAECFDQISDEFEFLAKYKSGWERAPYPPTFVTVDAVVTISGHLLLVERGAMPGKGLWALPGGFLMQHETLLEGMLRELYEETRLAVPKPVIAGSIVKSHTYDDPYRSQRGRTITQAYHIKLRDDAELPKIKGSDDAKKAFWVPLSEVVKSRSRFFEDHMSIIEHMLGI